MSTVKAIDAYKQYVALKLHFNSDKYDYFKAGGAIKTSIESFQKRNDYYQFQKLARKHDEITLCQMLVANLLEKKDLWIGDLFSEEAQNNYFERKKVKESLTYTFSNDIEKLKTLNKSDDDDRPLIVRAVLQKEIAIETFAIMCDLYNLIKKFDKKLDGDPIWQELRLRTTKYLPFINYEKKKFKELAEK